MRKLSKEPGHRGSEIKLVWADTLIATVDVGKFPQAVEFNTVNNNIYVVDFGSNTVSIIQTIALKPVADAGSDKAVNSLNRFGWMVKSVQILIVSICYFNLIKQMDLLFL